MERRGGLVALDMRYLDGHDLRALPAIERKARLRDLAKPADGIIQYSQHVEGNDAEFFAAVDKMGLEGMAVRSLTRASSGSDLA